MCADELSARRLTNTGSVGTGSKQGTGNIPFGKVSERIIQFVVQYPGRKE